MACFLVARTVASGLFAFLDSILIFISVFLILNLQMTFESIFRRFFCSSLSKEPVVSQQIGKTFVKSHCLDKRGLVAVQKTRYCVHN